MLRKSVVFPAPLRPSKPTILPFSILSEMLLSAVVLPNRLVRFFGRYKIAHDSNSSVVKF